MNLTRRNLLGAGLSMGLTGVAGCAARRAGAPANVGDGVVAPSAVFAGTGFDGEDLVVTLVDDHDVTGVNLISPDGSLFAQAPVDIGVTTVRLPILDITPVRWVHYTPGVHELVAVRGNGEPETMEIEMHPDLRIVEVRQYRDGEGADFGLLEVTVENSGSGPSWVHQITYVNAPNWTANDPLSPDPGIIAMHSPNEIADAIIQPGNSQQFIDGAPPILLRNPEISCDQEFEGITIVVGTGDQDKIEKTINVQMGGEAYSAGLVNEYTCSKFSISEI